ncbi:serine/threonine-protein kinase-like protein At3g51990 [Spinacia oleracea]|uniref:Serine/threonine-protein kinase-like protein At3g51990 n=1 Tax=Spinacia oleracea TaxID=3562 RepID=A0A9R0J820_SPIOL|nr:serine/threonine-protein kinase-like protein At3g51990 [Spinacia oleracea]
MRFLCNSHSAISTCRSTNQHHKQQPIKLTRFSYSALETATNAFSPRVLLGKGSHGAVYRAVLNNNTLTAAVKKPTSSSETAENEIEILSKLQTRRIVNLLGYAVDPNKKLLLVVEYMPNGALYDHLHKHEKPPGLVTRVRFALQIAKAIRTLHRSDPPVIHRDIKSSNVLIDERENARLGDFGLAIKGHVEDVRVMATPPAGTLGYLDPSYLAPGDLSTKSDIFSFGILLLEIISGRKAIDIDYSPPSIIDWALPLIKSGGYQGILDRRIKSTVDQTVLRELALLAAKCVRSTAEKRPPVSVIVDCLKKIYKRVKVYGFPVWGRIRRRRVKRVEGLPPSDDEFDGCDWEEESSVGGIYRLRKVSNVDLVDEETTRVCHPTVRSKSKSRSRSKSVGAFRELVKVGPEVVSSKKRGQVTVKISTVKLSKSRSMGMLYSGRSGGGGGGGGGNRVKNPHGKEVEVEVFPLLVKCNSSKLSEILKLES